MKIGDENFKVAPHFQESIKTSYFFNNVQDRGILVFDEILDVVKILS